MKTLNILSMMTLVVLATACQEEEYGYSFEEVYNSRAAVAHRQEATVEQYNEEFAKEFKNVDRQHDWMITPDTCYSAHFEAVTRGIEVPTINRNDSIYKMSADEVRGALGYMEETKDNRNKAVLDFEYIAVKETTYDIMPVFWGRKFCNNNEIGVYYIDAQGQKHDMGIFWSDVDPSIQLGYNGQEVKAAQTDQMLTDLSMSYEKPVDCTTCKGTGTVKIYYVCQSCGKEYNKMPNKEQCTERTGWYGSRTCGGKVVAHTDCQTCHGTGHTTKTETVKPEYYVAPHYTLTVPAGMKWGLYLRTNKTQASATTRINWYSNSDYNDDNVPAAATFTWGGVNYVSFEDAPHNTHNGGGTGTCSCGYGHYDQDFNDIVLAITPRPTKSTYKSVSYRVMCEDLGGSFDWDFNDIVYDILYEEGTGYSNPTLSIRLCAVGGTLPVQMVMDNWTSNELHSYMGRPDSIPVNVEPGRHAEKPMQIIHTIDLGEHFSLADNDIRDYAKQISFNVNGYTTVIFPQVTGNATPQCFMTSVGMDWSSELVNIADTYTDFRKWVSDHRNEDWWKTGEYGTFGEAVER